MGIKFDAEKGRRAAQSLYDTYLKQGILGHGGMPEDVIPFGMTAGSLEHIMFLTLTVSIDYQRDKISLWSSSRNAFENEDTRYLFCTQSLHEAPFEKVAADMKKYGLSKRYTQDTNIWRTLGITFYKKWGGNPLNFLKYYNFDAPLILDALKKSTHLHNSRETEDFPFLRGDKIGPVWIKMLADTAGIRDFINLDKVPVPVDIHVARASLALGIVKGRFEGRLEDLFGHIRREWFESIRGISLKSRPMIALDIDEPLWHLSKYGCAKRDKLTGECPAYEVCEAKDLCIGGRICIENGKVELNT